MEVAKATHKKKILPRQEIAERGVNLWHWINTSQAYHIIFRALDFSRGLSTEAYSKRKLALKE